MTGPNGSEGADDPDPDDPDDVVVFLSELHAAASSAVSASAMTALDATRRWFMLSPRMKVESGATVTPAKSACRDPVDSTILASL